MALKNFLATMGLEPTRIETPRADGSWHILVRPATRIGGDGVETILTADQFVRYREWRDRKLLIQDALPELSPSQREGLMTGFNDEEFHNATKDDDEP